MVVDARFGRKTQHTLGENILHDFVSAAGQPPSRCHQPFDDEPCPSAAFAGIDRASAGEVEHEGGHLLSLKAAHQLKIGRAHVWTPVTNAHLVCRLLLDKKT